MRNRRLFWLVPILLALLGVYFFQARTSDRMYLIYCGKDTPATDATLRQVEEVLSARLKAMRLTHRFIRRDKSRLTLFIARISKQQQDRIRRVLTRPGRLELSLVHPDNQRLTAQLMNSDQTAPNGFERVTREIGMDGALYHDFFYKRTSEQATDKRKSRSIDFSRVTFEYGIGELTAFYPLKGLPDPPPGYDILLIPFKTGRETLYRPMYIKRRVVLDNRSIISVEHGRDPMNQPYIQLVFDARGARALALTTSAYCPHGSRNATETGRQMAMVYDGLVLSAPEIRKPILDGVAHLTGLFTEQEILDIITVLKGRELPTPVQLVSEKPASLRTIPEGGTP